MVRIKLFSDRLHLSPVRGAKVSTFTRRIVIPKRSIMDVAIHDTAGIPVRLRRKIGTHIPGLLLAGSYRSSEGRHFYYLKAGNEAIKLNLQQFKFDTVCVDVIDALDATTMIMSWLEEQSH